MDLQVVSFSLIFLLLASSSPSVEGINCYHGHVECRGMDCMRLPLNKKPQNCSTLPDGGGKDYDTCWSTWTMATYPKTKRRRKQRSVYRGCITTSEMSTLGVDLQVEMGSCGGVSIAPKGVAMIQCFCDWDGCNGEFTLDQQRLIELTFNRLVNWKTVRINLNDTNVPWRDQQRFNISEIQILS